MRPVTQQAFVDAARRLSSRLPGRWDRRAREVGKVALNYRGNRRAALRHVQYRFVRQGSQLLVAPFGPGQIVVDAADDEIGRTVFITGGYEREHMTAAIRHLAESGRSTEGKVFVDAGANIGTSTFDALLQFGFGHAVCFEPDPQNVRLLRLSAMLNDLEARVEVHEVALSDRDGPATLRRSPTNSGDHRIVADGASGGLDEAVETVECRRLDSVVEAGLIDPATVGLIWVDTQGHEPHVLRGATSLLAAGVPVVLEYCPWVLLEAADDLEALVTLHFSRVVDLRVAAAGRDAEAWMSPHDVAKLRSQYAQRGYTDLLFLP